MKQLLRSKVAKISSYIEIYLSILILIGIVIVSFGLIKDIYLLSISCFKSGIIFNYEDFISYALLLIIGVEFVKMLAKHTLGSTIEVLLFAIARKLVVETTNTSMDLFLGVVAIAVLFAIKKYLFTYSFDDYLKEGFIVGGATSIPEANKIASVNIPGNIGNTLGGVISNMLEGEGEKIAPGKFVKVEDAILKIENVRDGLIDKVHIINDSEEKNKINIFNKFKKN